MKLIVCHNNIEVKCQSTKHNIFIIRIKKQFSEIASILLF